MVKNFAFPDSARKDNFGVQYDGYLYAAEEGYYDLGLEFRRWFTFVS